MSNLSSMALKKVPAFLSAAKKGEWVSLFDSLFEGDKIALSSEFKYFLINQFNVEEIIKDMGALTAISVSVENFSEPMVIVGAAPEKIDETLLKQIQQGFKFWTMGTIKPNNLGKNNALVSKYLFDALFTTEGFTEKENEAIRHEFNHSYAEPMLGVEYDEDVDEWQIKVAEVKLSELINLQNFFIQNFIYDRNYERAG